MIVNLMLYDICWALLPSPRTIALFPILPDISYANAVSILTKGHSQSAYYKYQFLP